MLPGKIAHDRNFSDVIYLDPATHTRLKKLVLQTSLVSLLTTNLTPLSPSILPSIQVLFALLGEHPSCMTPIEGDVFINDLDRFVEAGACGTQL